MNEENDKRRGYFWQTVSGVIAILLVASVLTNGFGTAKKSGLDEMSGYSVLEPGGVGDKAVQYINDNLLQEGMTATLKNIEDSDSMYKITLEVDGHEFESYATKNGNLLIPNGQGVVDMNQPVEKQEAVDKSNTQKVGSFDMLEDADVCKNAEGKPIVSLFSATWCPHCNWIKNTFDKVIKEYVAEGKIEGHHWQVDINNDTLTEETEDSVPDSQMQIYRQFDPDGYVPAFVFGCKYYRVGNGYESEGDAGLIKEEEEFRKIIDELLNSN